MAKLIVGLGNPGKEYAKTRHNVGFWCVDHIARMLGTTSFKEKWQAKVAESVIGGERVYFMMPMTYMNDSGRAVGEAVHFLKQSDFENDLLVVYDDLDLPVGNIRLRAKGSAGGHNGMKSIIQAIGSSDFPRIRIGIGRPPFDITVRDFVLSGFGKSERELIDDAVERAAKAAVAACQEPFAIVMNVFNSQA